MMDQINISKSSPDQKDSPKAQDPTTLVPSYRRVPQFLIFQKKATICITIPMNSYSSCK